MTQLNAQDSQRLQQILASTNEVPNLVHDDLAEHSAEHVAVAFERIRLMATKCDAEAFERYINSGEMPEFIELSDAELELMRGGLGPLIGAVWLGLRLGTVIVGGGIMIHASMTMRR